MTAMTRRVRTSAIGNARFSSWEIWLQTDGSNPATIDYPQDASADEGEAWENVGDVFLEPARNRILVAPRVGQRGKAVQSLIAWADHERRSGNFDVTMSDAEIALEERPMFRVASLGRSLKVVRCPVVGCDTYQQWHLEDRSTLDRCGQHVACDLSRPEFRCRLVYDEGRWVPDFALRAPAKANPVDAAEALGLALVELTLAARRLDSAR